VRLLLDEGAVLDETLRAHLNDLIMWRELDAEQINERIGQHSEALSRRVEISVARRGLRKTGIRRIQ